MGLVPRKLFIEWTSVVKQAVGESALPRKLIIQWAFVVKQADCETVEGNITPEAYLSRYLRGKASGARPYFTPEA